MNMPKKKGPPKGFIPKSSRCKKCDKEVNANVKVCPYCLRNTCLVTTAKEFSK